MSRLDDTLALVRAGYSKAEISAMLTPETEEPEHAPADPVPDVQPESPAPANTPAPAGITLTADQFEKLVQRANLASATYDLPPVRTAEAAAADRLKNLIGGIE